MRSPWTLALGLATLGAVTASCASAPTREASGPATQAPRGEEAPRADAAPPQEAPAPSEEVREPPPAPPAPEAEPEAGAAGPTDRAEAGAPPRAPPPPPTPAALREAVRRVASHRGRAAEVVPRALQALAGMLGQLAGGSPAARASVDRMRAEIDALAGLRAVDLERADRVKAALARGAAALGEIARRRGAGELDAWVDGAAAAVAAVEAETPLGLQRAAVQDALRALADAVLVAEQLGSR